MYRLHNSSEHSGVTNMYSLSNAGGSRAATPQQIATMGTAGSNNGGVKTSLASEMGLQRGARRPSQQQQHYLMDDVDHVRFLHSQQAAAHAQQQQQAQHAHDIHVSAAAAAEGFVNAQGGTEQQAMNMMSHSMTLPHSLSSHAAAKSQNFAREGMNGH